MRKPRPRVAAGPGRERLQTMRWRDTTPARAGEMPGSPDSLSDRPRGFPRRSSRFAPLPHGTPHSTAPVEGSPDA